MDGAARVDVEREDLGALGPSARTGPGGRLVEREDSVAGRGAEIAFRVGPKRGHGTSRVERGGPRTPGSVDLDEGAARRSQRSPLFRRSATPAGEAEGRAASPGAEGKPGVNRYQAEHGNE